jgi:transcriptional regulator with XRE-family HTH domain
MTPKSDEYAVILDGALLKEAREALGMSLRQVSAKAKLAGHSFLWQLENGRRHTCSAELAWNLALTLRLTHPQMRRIFDFRRVARAA